MSLSSEEEVRIRAYLLDQLSEEERTQVEDQYFRDGAYFETVDAIEDDILRDYARGRLNKDESAVIMDRLTHVGDVRERYSVIRTMVAAKSSYQRRALPGRHRLLRWREVFDHYLAWSTGLRVAAGATALAVIVGLTWLTYVKVTLPRRPAVAETGKEAAGQAPPVYTVWLTPQIRGADPPASNWIKLPSNAVEVELRVAVPFARGGENFRVRIQAVGIPGPPIVVGNLRVHLGEAGVRYAIIRVGSARLSRGDYTLTIEAMLPGGRSDEMDVISFRVAPE